MIPLAWMRARIQRRPDWAPARARVWSRRSDSRLRYTSPSAARRSRRSTAIRQLDAVIPWARLIALIEPHYPKAGQGRQPLGLEKMLRVYFLQQFFSAVKRGRWGLRDPRTLAGGMLAGAVRARN